VRCATTCLDEQALPDTPLIAMVSGEHAFGGRRRCRWQTRVGALFVQPWRLTSTMRRKRLETISGIECAANKKVFRRIASAASLLRCPRPSSRRWDWPRFPASSRLAPPPFKHRQSPTCRGRPSRCTGAGARLDGNYPLSIALNGQALNITMVSQTRTTSTSGWSVAGEVCRTCQRLLGHLETSLKDLERARVGV